MTEEEALKAAALAVFNKAKLLGDIADEPLGGRWLNEDEQLCLEAPKVWLEMLQSGYGSKAEKDA